MDYYAEGRSPAFATETVQIFSRPAIYQADRTTNEGKIDAMSGTLEIIAEHSNHVSRATSTFKEEVNSSMLSIAGLRGGPGTIKCPFMKIAFSNAINPDYEEDNDDGLTREGNGKTTLFDQGWDGQLVFTDTKVVAEKQVAGGLVAGYTPQGATIPQVVPLESSLARKEGRTWRKFNPAENQLPNSFITECFTPAVRDKLKQIREGDSLRLKTPSTTDDRLDMSVIAILCDTHFTTSKALNKHTEKMHGSMSLRRLPPAIPIPFNSTASSSPDVTPPTAPAIPHFHGPVSSGTMTDFLTGNSFEKVTKEASTKEVAKRWSIVTRKMTNELYFTQADGITIHKNFWGEVVIATRKFFDNNQSWLAQLSITATKKTGHDDVFTPNYHGSVTTLQLDSWIQESWDELNRSTSMQKVGKLIKYPIPSKDVKVQYNIISKEVRERIGTTTEVLLPVRIPGKPEIDKALVNISQLLTTFQLAYTWENYEPRFWDVMRKEKIDKKLMPDDYGDTPLSATSLAEAISSVQETLADKGLSGGGQGSFSVIDGPKEEEYADIQIESLPDEEISLIRALALQVEKETHPESALPKSDDQVTTLRKRNKFLYAKDAKKKQCPRKKCGNPRTCFSHRENLAKKKGSLYILIRCKKTKDEATATPPKKRAKDDDSIASVLHNTQKSTNYALHEGTLEIFNDEHKKELEVIWDTTANVYRLATDQEKADPSSGTLYAPKWGSFLGKKATPQDIPSCLIDLKTLKQKSHHQNIDSYLNYTVTVQTENTDVIQTEAYYQAPATPTHEVAQGENDDIWTESVMMEYEMEYENEQEFTNPIATTDDINKSPLTAYNREHKDTDWDTTAIAIQAVTIQQNPSMEDTSNHPSKQPTAPPTEITKDQPERRHTITHRRSRASHHQPTSSTKGRTRRRRTTSPNQGNLPQPNQQGQNEHEYSTCKRHQLTRVENGNEDKAGQHQNALSSLNPQNDSARTKPLRNDSAKTRPEANTKASQLGTERTCYMRSSLRGTEQYTRPINIPKSPFGSERYYYKLESPSGTEQLNIYAGQVQNQSILTNQHHRARSLTMILPVFKAISTTNRHGKDILRSQPADSTPPAATYLDSRDAMNDIMTITGDHEYIDDMAGTSTPIQIRSRPGEVSIFETDTKIISFISPSSQKLRRTILKNMKSPIMMKKYLDAYTLYVGQNTLQIFANFDSDPPITSSRISSTTSPESPSENEVESDTDSGVGRASPTQEDDLEERMEKQNNANDLDDQFTVLWSGTDDSGDLGDVSEAEEILPDILTESDDEDNPDDIVEEEEETPLATTTLQDGETESILSDLPTRSYSEADKDDIAEEEEETDQIMSELRIVTYGSATTSTATSTPPTPTEFFKTEVYFSDTSAEEDEEDDDTFSRIAITNIESLDETAEKQSTSSPLTDLNSLCQALSNISLNSKGEYVEKDDDTKDFATKAETLTAPPTPAPRKLTAGAQPAPRKMLLDTGSLGIIHLKDPLSIPKPEKKEVQFTQEQAHNILAPYYRTIDEPWDHQTASDPRITLAAMFKANSNKFRQDSVARQCSRPGCQYTIDCYYEREWEQRQGRGLYHYTQCI